MWHKPPKNQTRFSEHKNRLKLFIMYFIVDQRAACSHPSFDGSCQPRYIPNDRNKINCNIFINTFLENGSKFECQMFAALTIFTTWWSQSQLPNPSASPRHAIHSMPRWLMNMYYSCWFLCIKKDEEGKNGVATKKGRRIHQSRMLPVAWAGQVCECASNVHSCETG